MRKNCGAKSWFFPLPVLIIGTYDQNGNPDAMNAAWGGLYEADQVVLCLSDNHKTTNNIKDQKAFTVSFGDAPHVVECDYVGMVAGNKEPNKLEKVGFHTTKSEFVNAPIIEEFPVTLECEFVKVNEDGNIIGQIVNISADESVLGENGKIDVEKLRIISFDPCANTYRELGGVVGKAFSDGLKLK